MTIANAPASFERLGLGDQLLGGVAAALHAVAAEVVLGLRREADVRHHRDAGVGEQLDLRHHRQAALELDRVRVGLLHEADRRVEGLLGRALVGPERQVSDDQRARRRAGDGADERDELVDRDRQRGLVGEDVVGGGVADEHHRDAGFVEGRGGVLVVRREHRPLLAALLHLLEVVDADLADLGASSRGSGRCSRSGAVRRGLFRGGVSHGRSPCRLAAPRGVHGCLQRARSRRRRHRV